MQERLGKPWHDYWRVPPTNLGFERFEEHLSKETAKQSSKALASGLINPQCNWNLDADWTP